MSQTAIIIVYRLKLRNIVTQLLPKVGTKIVSRLRMLIFTRERSYFKNGDKNVINCSQIRKIAQLISEH